MRKKTAIIEMEIECPECGTPIIIAANKLVDGEAIGCLNCSTEFVLTREMDEDTGAYHWVLDKLEEESDRER